MTGAGFAACSRQKTFLARLWVSCGVRMRVENNITYAVAEEIAQKACCFAS